ncbi:hypothetical protein AYI70_g8721 [Smittium culicis]|uniref:Uncharacterized protein n=1 Tax=Smittium culicis TaxID=133412 RepID=A0A1R1XEQ8_9FUNG|nr:hypothetical protein AYI70_g8721 [Smittium culicis]
MKLFVNQKCIINLIEVDNKPEVKPVAKKATAKRTTKEEKVDKKAVGKRSINTRSKSSSNGSIDSAIEVNDTTNTTSQGDDVAQKGRVSRSRSKMINEKQKASPIKKAKGKVVAGKKKERQSEMFLYVDDSNFAEILNLDSGGELEELVSSSSNNEIYIGKDKDKESMHLSSSDRNMTSETGELSMEKLQEFEKGLASQLSLTNSSSSNAGEC